MEAPALEAVSLELREGQVVALLGPSGSGKSTLLRALAGLVPHFHGGRFGGSVEVAGLDTRRVRPAALAGVVASVFQDPEDQVVMTRVANEVAFGPENLGVVPAEIPARVEEALAAVGVAHLAGRRTTELSGGELQRVSLAAALACRPRLLLLDEPTSQLDPGGADAFLRCVERLGAAVVLSEQRVGRALAIADRVLFVEGGRLLLDAPVAEARRWLAAERPSFLGLSTVASMDNDPSGALVTIDEAWFSYGRIPALAGASLELLPGELVVLEGPNGSGKSTLAKLAAGLLEPEAGSVSRAGRAGYLSQDPGRYLACERVLDEVALAVGGDGGRARAALESVGLGWAAERHPRDLSSGERERLGLAAVLVAEPDVLILDEPTRGMDPDRKAALAARLLAYAARGRAVLVATHDRDFPAHRRVALGERRELLAA
ncbi:MAG: ATP-binding cassette domain-containing protein [Thermoleophilia bacterium]|nr:ATP-binding cassette domain-containing protein [Thermoleophilia bacterium]